MLLFEFLSEVFKSYRSKKIKENAKSFPSQPDYLPKLTHPNQNAEQSFFHPLVWACRDRETVAKYAQKIIESVGPGYHYGDNFLTWGRNMSMLDDQHFMQAWQSNAESASDETIIWRRYVLACAAHHCVQLDGDFVECGAYTGVGVKTVVDYLGGSRFPKTFWAFDIFEHNSSMLNHSMPEHGPNLFNRVKNKFTEYPQVKIVRGLIPDVFKNGCPEKISYLHIDLNQAVAEIAALDVLFEKMTPGGILILDDYEWSGTYREQKMAEDKWLEERGYRVIPLPTGQGLVIKR